MNKFITTMIVQVTDHERSEKHSQNSGRQARTCDQPLVLAWFGTLGQNGPNQAIAKKVPTKLTINPVPAIVVGKLPYEFCVDIDTK
jgi:hypothetical protein